MDTTITIKTRTVVLTLVVMVALLAAYFLGSSRPGSGSASAAEDPSTTPSPQIVMTGTGEASGVPDEVAFDVTVTQTAGDVSTALDQAASAAHRVLAALGDAGVASKDVQTTGLSIRPQYDYVNGSSVLTGYTASESLSVLVKKLSDAGDAITTAVDAGGNAVRVGNVRLKIGDTDALMEQARDDAVAQAKEKADQYAQAAGATLGSVVSVREVSASQPYPRSIAYLAGAADAAKSIPIKAGSQNLKVTVKVVWSLS
jgi:uncharacterized protein YggE